MGSKVLAKVTLPDGKRKGEGLELYLRGGEDLEEGLGSRSLAEAILDGGVLEDAGEGADDAEVIGGQGNGDADAEDEMDRGIRAFNHDPLPGAAGAHDHAGDAIGAGVRDANLGAAGGGDAGLLAAEAFVEGVPILDAVVFAKEGGDVIDGLLLVGAFEVEVDVLGMKDIGDGDHMSLLKYWGMSRGAKLGQLARRERRASPSWGCKERATPPDAPF